MLILMAAGWFAVIWGCAIAFGELLALIERPDGSTAVDASITSWAVAHRTHGLTTAARVLSTLGSQKVLLPAAVLAMVLLVVRRRLFVAAVLFLAWGGAIALYSLTKLVVGRMRPPADLWLTHVASSSFPSGHAVQSLSTFTALAIVGAAWLPSARWVGGAIAVALALGVGWSRVYLGVHWATDVGAGWLMAATWIAILVRLMPRRPPAPTTSLRPRGSTVRSPYP